MQFETSFKDTYTNDTNMKKKNMNNENKQIGMTYMMIILKTKKIVIFEIIMETKQKIQLL